MSPPCFRRRLSLVLITAGLSATAWALEPERITLETFDGQTLAGDYYAPVPVKTGAPMVILLHMYRSDRTAWKPLIEPLHAAGFATLAVDLRGHGESATPETQKRVEQRDSQLFRDMYNDVRAAYDFLAARDEVDRSRFALVGASVGCSIALQYAAEDRSVDALVCLSPGANYMGLDARADIARISGRKIWLLASEDPQERAGVEALKALADVDTQLLPGSDHGTRLFGKVSGLEQKIADYLKTGVGGPSQTIVYGSIRSQGKVYHLAGSEWIDEIAPSNLRYYSSPQEAEARGLRKARSRGPRDKPSTAPRKP